MRKALSAIISTLLLIVISISIIATVAPWMYELTVGTTNSTATDTMQQIRCRNAGYDFDTSYGSYGADWNFTGNGTDWLKAKITNTGNLDLFGFSFEATLDSDAGPEILHLDPTPAAPGASNPLRPSSSVILFTNITQDINGSYYSLKAVKVLNAVCPLVSASVDV